LLRIALTEHKWPSSAIVSRAVRQLTRAQPSLRLLVSYADPKQGHTGILYQAANWLYAGPSQAQRFTLGLRGEVIHKKTVHSLRGTIVGLPKSELLWKRKYLYPLDKAMRRQIDPLRQPYPKREQADEAKETARRATSAETGGASPTRPLSDPSEGETS